MHAASLPPLARNIQQLRTKRGLTLSGLSQRSGVAKSTLSLIESGKGNPTIETIWAIANALETPFGTLVEGIDTIGESSSGAQGTGEKVRFIGRYGTSPEVEVYEMTIGAGHRRSSSAHPPGVYERVMVLSGDMLVGDAAQTVLLRAGQSHFFKADVEHSYAAPNGDATAIVFVEYPGAADGATGYTVVREYPRTQADWDGLRAIVDLAAVEVAQGFTGFFLRLRGRDADRDAIAHHLGLSNASGQRWPLLAFVDQDDRGAWLALLPRIHTSAFRVDAEQSTVSKLPSLALAIRLAAVAEQELVTLQQDAVPILESLASGSSWTLATLASEVALQHGHLMLPSQLGARSQRELRTTRRMADVDFSSRINVDHYDAYELLHPAYARQVVALAQDILALDAQGARGLAIDVGSGPGAALLMLLELLPDLRVHAVEPDSTAFAYLLDNTKGSSRVHCECQDFLELDPPTEPVSFVTSVGSSHHFNTAFMLQKAWRLLTDDGILCVADELLPFFSDRDSRNNALIRHHAACVLASMASVDALRIQHEDTTDARLYRQMRESLVQAVLQATHGQTSAAVKRCRDLYALVKQTLHTKQALSAIGAFVRFYALEIQAMVAGFDYEIERKTYPRRLVAMAQAAGFELVSHRRVYATSGPDEWDGGTHVFAFRKRTASLHGF
jgi:transcriptional regulator with XRE-family HTH domain/SAM-dependent methyltransferase